MDKSWVKLDRAGEEYKTCLQQFIDDSLLVASHDGMLKCPCKKCYNRFWREPNLVWAHLLYEGMDPRYEDQVWVFHGEHLPDPDFMEDAEEQQLCEPTVNEIHDVLYDVFGSDSSANDRHVDTEGQTTNVRAEYAEKFYNLLNDANTNLYPGSTKMKKLEFLVKLYQAKCLSGSTDKGMDIMLKLVKSILPDGETLPNSFYDVKQLIKDLGLTYQKIDACPNDCMLYWKESILDDSCKHCGQSRYQKKDVEENDDTRKVPAKVLRYFPLTPRLQRLYLSRYTADHMSWHAKERTDDGILRHPADSPAWKHLDKKYPFFADEQRNVRLGLASDGFNPFGHMSSSHSTWPVVITVYNLPPWMCMKQPYMILSLLIPGPTAPGNDIDVYMAPLIDELKSLWEVGIPTYDAANKETFIMRAALLWTISDFPAYANLSGWSTKGKMACPNCNYSTDSFWLSHGRKFSYMGHRRFLPLNHRFRRQFRPFNGKQEHRPAPVPLSGIDCLLQLSSLQFKFGKGAKINNVPIVPCVEEYKGPWKKQSIFFTLTYWKDLLIRHNLDVMHIEKNICDNVVGTLLGIDGKSKDTIKARADLELLNIKPKLHPVRKGSKTYLPPAAFNLSNAEKTTICEVLASIKVPDGFSSNITRCVRVKERKLIGLKSHDCHVMLHEFLPIAIRCVLNNQLCMVMLELCSFFRNLCQKNLSSAAFSQLTPSIALTLCHLERIFPPAFFTIMMHLPIHLAEEASIGGPVHYRWMYPFERFLGTLKKYVRNKNHPEGSITLGYIAEDTISFCSMYLEGVESRRNRPNRNADHRARNVPGGFSVFLNSGHHIGRKGLLVHMDEAEWERVSRYVLSNCPEVQPFERRHKLAGRANRGRRTLWEVDRESAKTFPSWFKKHVKNMQVHGAGSVHEDLCALASGPSRWCKKYKRYVINGYRFRVKKFDKKNKTQNSGVFVTSEVTSYASTRDTNPIDGRVDYYGVLTDIIELEYHNDLKIVLFDCDWPNTSGRNNGVKADIYGFQLVNFNHLQAPGDTLILASQAQQVYYVQDPKEQDWHVARKTKPRDLFDMNNIGHIDPCEPQNLDDALIEDEEIEVRTDVLGITVNRLLPLQVPAYSEGGTDEEPNSDDESG